MSEIYKFRARGVEYGSGVTEGERNNLLAERAGSISNAVLSTTVGDTSLQETFSLAEVSGQSLFRRAMVLRRCEHTYMPK